MEACHNDWFRFTMWDYINPVRARMAAYIGSNVNDTVFVENASSGVNAVIKSLARIAPSGQKFLFLNTAYFMVKQVFAYVEPNNRLQVNVTQPLSNASVIANVKAALEANKGNVFAASFSHIVSVPGMSELQQTLNILQWQLPWIFVNQSEVIEQSWTTFTPLQCLEAKF